MATSSVHIVRRSEHRHAVADSTHPLQVVATPEIATVQPAVSSKSTRRRIDRVSGQALEMLGHAIEYLADEHVIRGGMLLASDPRVQAIRILMEANRAVYFSCPELPTLAQRCSQLFKKKFN